MERIQGVTREMVKKDSNAIAKQNSDDSRANLINKNAYNVRLYEDRYEMEKVGRKGVTRKRR